MNTTVVELYRAARFWQARQLRAYTKESSYLYQPIIVDSILPHSCMASAWIVFAHLTVDSFTPDCTMEQGTFVYEVWILQDLDERPRLILEEVVMKKRQVATECGMKSLATDIDRLAMDNGKLYVRDRRLLKDCDLDLVRTWRDFKQSVLPVEIQETGEDTVVNANTASSCASES